MNVWFGWGNCTNVNNASRDFMLYLNFNCMTKRYVWIVICKFVVCLLIPHRQDYKLYGKVWISIHWPNRRPANAWSGTVGSVRENKYHLSDINNWSNVFLKKKKKSSNADKLTNAQNKWFKENRDKWLEMNITCYLSLG